MFRFSPNDYKQIAEIWNGPHPEDGSELRVEDAIPEGAAPNLPAEPQLTAPGVDMGFVREVAKHLSR
jgi:Mn-containing catalase